MYSKLLATTALTLVMTGGAFAQTTPAPVPMDQPVVETPADPLVTAADRGINADGWLATEIIGESIYNSTADDAETIGEVNDFVLDHNGSIGAVVVGVGGFLGIGQKNVAINWDDLELTTDTNGDHRLVANMTREQLENAADFDRAEWLASENRGDAWTDPATPMAPAPMTPAPMTPAPMEPAPAPMAPAPMAPAPMDPAAPVAPADPGLAAPGTDATMGWDTYMAVPTSEISVDELTGTTVYGFDDESIGSIGDVILSDSGEVDAVIIDFGGFLGIGTKPVAVSFDNLEFLRDGNNDLVLRTTLTREQLEAAPEYDADVYLSTPGQNVIVVQ